MVEIHISCTTIVKMTSESKRRLFHERFDIKVGTDEARRRFLNRVTTLIICNATSALPRHSVYGLDLVDVYEYIAFELGTDYSMNQSFHQFIEGDFGRCLQFLEALYGVVKERDHYEEIGALNLSNQIVRVVEASEVDLGISWQPPIFVRTGAPLLDENLVNEPLRWLSDPKYESVYDPFSKGLSHYLEATNKPERLADVITDMYEAVEALARIVTGKDRDLSGNRETFIKSIRASDHYRRLLKDYVEYGSEFRHAVRLGKPRPTLSEPEVESFIYLTGLFIRLAIRQAQPST